MSEMTIYKEFEFDAAHRLTQVPEGHKCSNLHGHTFKLTVFLRGEVNPDRGWVVDYGEIKEVMEPIMEQLDHSVLNDLPGIQNPTSENLCVWIWDRIKPAISQLWQIELKETKSSGCLYSGK
jgi:6-pyruvoyltetrahydropterin/6-carboxytetrahydropterin synthase